MVEFVPLEQSHLDRMGLEFQFGEFSYAALRDGKPVAVGGINEQWEGRGSAWFHANDLTPREWCEVTMEIEKGLSRAKFTRIEVAVVMRHSAGQRWVERLGFRKEYLARKYTPKGEDAWLYAIVR